MITILTNIIWVSWWALCLLGGAWRIAYCLFAGVCVFIAIKALSKTYRRAKWTICFLIAYWCLNPVVIFLTMCLTKSNSDAVIGFVFYSGVFVLVGATASSIEMAFHRRLES